MSFNNCANRKSLLTELFNCLKIIKEYYVGIYKFRKLGPCVTIYGSARINKDSAIHSNAQSLANQLSEAGFGIMTGGGPGIMQAANTGAYSNNKSAGCSISIPYEKFSNPYLNTHHHCNYFFVRKVLLTKFSSAFVAFPGGFGTLDELFEMLTLIKTHKMENFPVILVGTSFWQPLINYIRDYMVDLGTVSESEMDCITVTDSLEETMQIIKNYCEGYDNGK